MREYADPGFEKYLKFGRVLLKQLTERRKDLRLNILREHRAPEAGVRMDIRSADFGDEILVFGSKPWDFLVSDRQSSSGGVVNAWLASIDKTKMAKLKVATNGNGTMRVVRTNGKSFAILKDITTGLKWVDDKQKIAAYEPVLFSSGNSPPTVLSAEDKKIVTYLTNGGNAKIADGTTVWDVISGTPTLLAGTRDNGYYILAASGTQTLRVYDITTGLLVDTTLPGTVVLYGTPKSNYTDVFSAAADYTAYPYATSHYIYRNGVLDGTMSASAQPKGMVASRDRVAAWGDIDGYFSAGSVFSSPVTERITVMEGVRNPTTGAYSYSSHTSTMTTNMFPDSGVWNSGFSQDKCYFFFLYHTENGGAGPGFDFGTSIIDNTGAVIQLTGLDKIHAPFPDTIAFKDRCCYPGVGASWNGAGYDPTGIKFIFSDGQVIDVNTTPTLSNSPTYLLSVGSQTETYVYISDGGSKYIIGSDGTAVKLGFPTRDQELGAGLETATNFTASFFVDQKTGFRLVGTATWAAAPTTTVHHVDEHGTFFQYDTSHVDYGVILSSFKKSETDRMQLIDKWG